MEGISMQNQDFEFFLQNIEELYQKYGHKFVAIKNSQILGAYDAFDVAVNETLKQAEIGTFLIQECFENKDACVQYFQGNVMPSPV